MIIDDKRNILRSFYYPYDCYVSYGKQCHYILLLLCLGYTCQVLCAALNPVGTLKFYYLTLHSESSIRLFRL